MAPERDQGILNRPWPQVLPTVMLPFGRELWPSGLDHELDGPPAPTTLGTMPYRYRCHTPRPRYPAARHSPLNATKRRRLASLSDPEV